MKIFKDEKEALEAFRVSYRKLQEEIGRVIVGQEQAIQAMLISVFCKGHAMLVGVPGLAKTKLVQTLAKTLDLSFSRIQFTPDLMPSDILGSEIMNKERELTFVSGPIFAHVVLADEINRTPPKTQAALLEAMQEKIVTIGGKDYILERPFFVFATQNPVEQEGTYPLPEAQLDRFMFEIRLDYPSMEEEREIVRATTSREDLPVRNIISQKEILDFQELMLKVPITDNVLDYAVNLVSKTRPTRNQTSSVADQFLQWGAGPRASQYLVLGAKCHALMAGKHTPDTEDVQAVAIDVLRHRIVRNFKATAEERSEEALIKSLL